MRLVFRRAKISREICSKGHYLNGYYILKDLV